MNLIQFYYMQESHTQIRGDSTLPSQRNINASHMHKRDALDIKMRRNCWVSCIFPLIVIMLMAITLVGLSKGRLNILMTPLSQESHPYYTFSCKKNSVDGIEPFLAYNFLSNYFDNHHVQIQANITKGGASQYFNQSRQLAGLRLKSMMNNLRIQILLLELGYISASGQICMKKCPSQTDTQTISEILINGSLTSRQFVNIYINQELNNVYSQYQKKYISYPVANRLCIPHLDYFKSSAPNYQNLNFYLRNTIIPFLANETATKFYLDFINNWYLLLISLIFSFIANAIVFQLISKYLSFIIKLSTVLIHIGLAGSAILFMYNAGTLKNSEVMAPYLGLPTFQFSYKNTQYATIFFILEGFWILTHIYLCKGFSKAYSIVKASHQLSSTINCNHKYSKLLCVVVGLMIMMGVFVSAQLYSIDAAFKVGTNKNEYILFSFSSIVYSWSYYHILYVLGTICILSLLIQVNSTVYKCLYFQNIASILPNHQFMRKAKYNFGCFSISFLMSPLKPFIRILFIIRKMIQDCYKLQNEERCIKIKMSTAISYVFYLVKSNGYLEQYIREEDVSLTQLNNLYFDQGNLTTYRIFQKAQLLWNCIRLAISLMTSLYFHAIMTFALPLRKDFIHLEYQLLLVFMMSYCVSGISLSYYSSAVDSIFYAYHYNRKYPLKYPLKNKENKQFIRKVVEQLSKEEDNMEEQDKNEK